MSLWYPVSLGPTQMDNCPFARPPRREDLPISASGQQLRIGRGESTTQLPLRSIFLVRWLVRTNPKGTTRRHYPDGTSHVFPAGRRFRTSVVIFRARSQFSRSREQHPAQHVSQFPPAGGARVSAFATTPRIQNVAGHLQACGYKPPSSGWCYMLMADASTQFINESIDFELFYLLGA